MFVILGDLNADPHKDSRAYGEPAIMQLLAHPRIQDPAPASAGETGPRQFGDAGPRQFGDGGPRQFGDGGPRQFGDGGPRRFGDGGPRQFGDGGPRQFGDAGPRQFIDASHPGPNDTRTCDFGRIDYVLPCRELRVHASGVFWPAPGDPASTLVSEPDPASDHRLVWVDLVIHQASSPRPHAPASGTTRPE
jgi:hypothetical protein